MNYNLAVISLVEQFQIIILYCELLSGLYSLITIRFRRSLSCCFSLKLGLWACRAEKLFHIGRYQASHFLVHVYSQAANSMNGLIAELPPLPIHARLSRRSAPNSHAAQGRAG